MTPLGADPSGRAQVEGRSGYSSRSANVSIGSFRYGSASTRC